MGGKQSKPIAPPTSGTTPSPPTQPMEGSPTDETKELLPKPQQAQSVTDANDPDYTIMPVALGFPYNAFQKKTAEDFKKVEYMFFLGAEFSRLVYCDVGILHLSMVKALGLSPDILNQVISAYDKKHLNEKFSQGTSIPAPASYRLRSCSVREKGTLLAKYISSPVDTTCMVVNPKAVKSNPYSILKGDDSILVFKGSSSLRNWAKNFASAKTFSINEALKSYFAKFGDRHHLDTNITSKADPVFKEDFKIATSYLEPILEILEQILSALKEVTPNFKRLFIFGHSKGGAECEVAGILFTLLMKYKNAFPELSLLEEVHMISYGAPKIVASSGIKVLNQIVFEQNLGKVTLTRIESVGRLAGDTVTTMPPWSVHPGWSQSSNTLDVIRQKYADVQVDGNYRRNKATWPFPDYDYDLWDDMKSASLGKAVEKVLGDPSMVVNTKLEEQTDPLKQGGEKSTYVKAKGSKWAPNSHMEQFGMFFLGSQRLAGMKNPANTDFSKNGKYVDPLTKVDYGNKTFTSLIYENCTRLEYVAWNTFRVSITRGLASTAQSLDLITRPGVNYVAAPIAYATTAAAALQSSTPTSDKINEGISPRNTGGKKNRTKRKMKKLNKKATHKRQR